MTIDNYLTLTSIISTITLSAISLWISLSTLKITKKSIQDANKPYLAVYIDYIDGIHFQKFITITNFGKTPAKIEQLEFHTKLDIFNEQFKLNSLVGATIAPNQKFQSVLFTDFKDDIKLTIKYSDMQSNLTIQNLTLKTNVTSHLLYTTSKNSTDTEEIHIAKLCTQALIKNLKR